MRQRLLVNRGGGDGVYKTQPVVTGAGVRRAGYCRPGQYHRSPPPACPAVQVLRSGVRTIALGTGRATSLELPYVAQNYDVQVGDVLVTSVSARCSPLAFP